MRTLVLGGIRSGKSQWAEQAIAESTVAGQPVRYLATGAAPDDDAEWSARIAAHRARRPSHWSTVETVDVTTQLRSATASPTLVDDIGGWLTAVMDRRGAWAIRSPGSITADVDELIDAVGAFGSPLALVSPEVGLTVVPPTASGRRFADELGGLNQRLAGLCDRVVLVVAGQPLTVKEPSRAESRQ
ncbi:bifunctional adenosylcobinamide kinase/adenosylcobinamide-phosphate guanylyltransferase [Mycolicibacterium moriokaense]|uniref:Adenosylcobinamide kinase n=1 Tax=Mycolicibacterium moriokaense TaxID=39691 RepID=A0A318HK79_9MYCO|nr:bifunctional adenosylcobinamide kinase/adenosylcobinamide-phosphate guanylyltransferase [Mycolicibacterium moriokaense]PXX08544.1 adenosylcobinamide kinase /adenosylcobinamide-phosphate guanylyltransferase [Mycolicibacterium moriokaense]